MSADPMKESADVIFGTTARALVCAVVYLVVISIFCFIDDG
jgi:hypothetical protein